MSLLFPPGTSNASVIPPLAVERRFKVRLRCQECRRESQQIIEMQDEPDDPATAEDFYGCGAINMVDPFCTTCDAETSVILGFGYIRQPTDV